MLHQNLCLPFSINAAFADLTVTHDAFTITDAFEVCVGNNLVGPFPVYTHPHCNI